MSLMVSGDKMLQVLKKKMSGSLGMVGKEAGEMNFYEQHKIIKK